MSRIVKFRAWDIERNLFIGPDYIENIGDEQDEWWSDEYWMRINGFRLFNPPESFLYGDNQDFPNEVLWAEVVVIGNIHENSDLLK
jgi:hypothetical protein